MQFKSMINIVAIDTTNVIFPMPRFIILTTTWKRKWYAVISHLLKPAGKVRWEGSARWEMQVILPGIALMSRDSEWLAHTTQVKSNFRKHATLMTSEYGSNEAVSESGCKMWSSIYLHMQSITSKMILSQYCQWYYFRGMWFLSDFIWDLLHIHTL